MIQANADGVIQRFSSLARQVKLPDTLRPQLHWGLMEGTGMETTFRQALRPMKTDCTGSEHPEHDRSCDTSVTTLK